MKQATLDRPAKFLLRLPTVLYREIERQASEAGCSINALLNQWIEDGVARVKFSRPPIEENDMQLAANIFTAKFVAYDEQGEPHFFHTASEAKKHCKTYDRRYFQWNTKEQKPRAIWSDATGRWEGISSHQLSTPPEK